MISWVSWRRRKHEPALLVGWLWFVVSLAPMIGVIQVGNQALADRYLYLAMLGPLIALVGSLAASVSPSPSPARRWIAAAGAPWAWASVAVAIVCLPLTWQQVGVWRDSLTLFSHALAAGHDSAVARTQLGLALAEADRPGDALPHLQRAVVLRADDADAWFNLGNAHAAVGDLPAAVAAFQRAIALDPDRFKAWNNLGILLVLGGDAAAADCCEISYRPGFPGRIAADLAESSSLSATPSRRGSAKPVGRRFRPLRRIAWPRG